MIGWHRQASGEEAVPPHPGKGYFIMGSPPASRLQIEKMNGASLTAMNNDHTTMQNPHFILE